MKQLKPVLYSQPASKRWVMRIRHLSIRNFRGIHEMDRALLDKGFPLPNFRGSSPCCAGILTAVLALLQLSSGSDMNRSSPTITPSVSICPPSRSRETVPSFQTCVIL